MKQLLALTMILGFSILLPGCDAKAQQNNAAAQKLDAEVEKINREALEKQKEEFESDGGLAPDSTQLDEVTESLEEAIENSTGEQAAVLQEQADIMKELQGLMKPYEQDFNELMGIGGIDPATIKDAADIDRRIELIGKLSAQNEKMDAELPALLRGLGKIGGTPLVVERQIPLIKKIRGTDRAIFRDMTSALGILRTHWDGVVVGADGNILFSEDTPDEAINKYNSLIGQVQSTGEEQGRLQQELMKIGQP